MPTTIELQDAYKRFTADQDKIMSPEETVRRFKERLAASKLDLLDRTVRIDNGRLGIPVFFSYCGPAAAQLTGTKKQMGKGATAAQAEASAVMELAERFSFFSFAKNPKNFFTATYPAAGEKAIPFEQIARSVHDQSEDLEAARRVFETIPLQWTRAYNLTRQAEVLVPFNWFYAINEFNGPSAGNCVEEALCQGICEIVERHTSSLVSHQKLKLPKIDPASATDPLVVEMLEKYRRAGIELHLTDFSLGMGIPSVGALAYDPSTFPAKSEIVWTAGTTPNPQKALSRALTEVAQLAGDFNSGANYVASGLPKFRSLEEAGFVTDGAGTVAVDTLPDLSSPNIRIEVEHLISTLADRQMEVIVIDTQHALLGIPAFYTIIPGAHFRERALGTSVGMFAAKLISQNRPPAEAVSELQKVEAALPGKYYVSFYRGTAHLELGDPQTALTFLQEALGRRPTRQDAASIHSYMGVCHKEMENYTEALAVLKEGERLDDERTDIFNLMGFCHFKLGQNEAAIDCFKKVIALDPSSAIDYANIASNYRDMGDRDQAVRYYLMALELDPSIRFAWENLAKLREDEK